jgi:hypothetical protein
MTAINNSFVSAARDDFEVAAAKEAQIGGLRDELNPEANKLNAVAFFAVVAKSMGLDNPSFKGRKKIAGEFRDVAASFGLKEASAKLACETAIKMTRHGAFGNAIEAAVKHDNVGNFAQEIGGIFAAEGITTASKLRKLLNPEAEVSTVDEIVFLAFKKVGVKKNDLKVTKAEISTGTVADEEAAQLLLDCVARIIPEAADVAATLIDAINNNGVEIEKVAA